IELAGLVHEFHAAVQRAAAGDVRPADPELALRTVERTRAEVRAAGRRLAPGAAPIGALEDAPAAAPAPPPEPERGRKGMLGLAIGVAGFAPAGVVAVYPPRPDPCLQAGVDAFPAGRIAEAGGARGGGGRGEPARLTARRLPAG